MSYFCRENIVKAFLLCPEQKLRNFHTNRTDVKNAHATARAHFSVCGFPKTSVRKVLPVLF
jgi:hypothetical protein